MEEFTHWIGGQELGQPLAVVGKATLCVHIQGNGERKGGGRQSRYQRISITLYGSTLCREGGLVLFPGIKTAAFKRVNRQNAFSLQS